MHCVCPNINNFEELDAYVHLTGTRFDEREAAMLNEYRETHGDMICGVGCSQGESACPQGIPVNAIMCYKYYFRTQRREKMAISEYAMLGGHNAGACEQACPYGVPIQGRLVLAHETLTLP